MRAILLLKIDAGQAQAATRRLKALPAISEASMIFGRYDAVAILNAESLDEIRSVLLAEVLTIPGVTDALTCLIAEEEIQPAVPPARFLKPAG